VKVVLFCGGLGMRMRDGVNTGPKPMAMVGERPLLWHVMRYYAHFGHTDFILCLGYGASYVKDFFLTYDETRSNDFVLENGARDLRLFRTDISNWRITFVDTGLKSPIGERLRRVRRLVEDDEIFLANYADVLTNAQLPDIIGQFAASDAVASLLAVQPQSSHHLVEIGDDGLISQVTPMQDLRQWENGGYFVLRQEIFEHLSEGQDLVEDAIMRRLVPQRRVLAYPYKGYWSSADTVKERARLEELYERGHCPWMIWDRDRSGMADVPDNGFGEALPGSDDSGTALAPAPALELR
jgi:glucose-1-phosphate cytidylyltransferase